jgi:hypothetical protein
LKLTNFIEQQNELLILARIDDHFFDLRATSAKRVTSVQYLYDYIRCVHHFLELLVEGLERVLLFLVEEVALEVVEWIELLLYQVELVLFALRCFNKIVERVRLTIVSLKSPLGFPGFSIELLFFLLIKCL